MICGMIIMVKSMKVVKKKKLKPIYSKILKILGIILLISLGLFLFYIKQINDLTRLGYSKEASRKILCSFKKDYVLSIGENKTLNAAFESKDYIEDNLEFYRKIKYVNHKHLIRNINKLLTVGYNPNDINIIITHGSDEAVERFSKREKIKYLEEFFSVSYAKLDNYDRYVKYSMDTGEDEELTVLYVNLDLDLNDYENSVLVSDFSLTMLVNKHRYLSEEFEPDDLVKIDSKYASSNDLYCSRLALNAYKKMSEAAAKEGYSIIINSAYRSYQDQVDLSDLYLKTYGEKYVEKFVAKPGYSEHQTGLAFDIGSLNSNVFANSKEYGWMKDNAYKYGFIERFTKKYEGITGFRSEPWHYRYVGVDVATEIHDNDMTLEEYYVINLDK